MLNFLNSAVNLAIVRPLTFVRNLVHKAWDRPFIVRHTRDGEEVDGRWGVIWRTVAWSPVKTFGGLGKVGLGVAALALLAGGTLAAIPTVVTALAIAGVYNIATIIVDFDGLTAEPELAPAL